MLHWCDVEVTVFMSVFEFFLAKNIHVYFQRFFGSNAESSLTPGISLDDFDFDFW